MSHTRSPIGGAPRRVCYEPTDVGMSAYYSLVYPCIKYARFTKIRARVVGAIAI